MTSHSRLSSQERREAIIQTAIELFSERGFRGTTTRELANACGVSEPVIYQHFATKSDLYTAIIDTVSQQGIEGVFAELEAFANAKDDYAYFRKTAEIIIHFYETNPGFIRLLHFSSLEKHELCELFYDRLSCKFSEMVNNYIQRRVDEGAFRSMNAQSAASHFIGGIAHYALCVLIFQFKLSRIPEKEEFLDETVRIFLHGVKA